MQIKRFFRTRPKKMLSSVLRCIAVTFFLLMQTTMIHAQQGITVMGTVMEKGETLPGVNVTIKGTSKGIMTDVDGNYSIIVPNGNAVLVFSFVGYLTQELTVGNRTRIDVELLEASQQIDEVVIVGYGAQKKVNLTGSVGVATSERLENRTITSVGQGLQGVIPGLNITYNSGNPTESAVFNVRGFESINGSGGPLILIDGVPGSIDKMNPNDVASISVLKDASSAAIYGARAAFGVILVETKRGTEGKAKISFSSQITYNRHIYPGYEPMKEGGTARKVFDDAIRLTTGNNGAYPPAVVDAALAYQAMKNPTKEDAWFYTNGLLYPLENYYMKDVLYRNYAPQQQYNVNISGSSENTSYFVSIGAIHKEGFFKDGNENYKRYNVLTKLDFKINDWIKLDENISWYTELNDIPHNYADQYYYQTLVRHFYSPYTFPDLAYYKEPGDRELYAPLIGMYVDNRNAIPYLKYGSRDKNNRSEIWLKQGITITPPVKGLKIIGDFSFMYNHRDDENVCTKVPVLNYSRTMYSLPLDDDPLALISTGSANPTDHIEVIYGKNTYYVLNTYAEYSRQDLGDHRFTALVGFNQEYGYWKTATSRRDNLLSENIFSLSAATGNQTVSDGKNELMLRGLFYRLNYSFKERYLFEANGRYDGTSRFPSKSRFGFFPSFSVAWRLSEEAFMAGTRDWLDNLKIRASYGELGNQVVVNSSRDPIYYPFITTMNKGTSTFLFNDIASFTDMINPGGLVANSLSWEKVVSKNIGLDVLLFKNRLDVSFDYFIRDTKDMLMYKSYPDLLGATAPSENAADLKNTGWEIAFSWSDKINQDWSYRLNLSLSDYQTEITKYDNPTGAVNSYYVGKKVGEIWGYKTVGLIQTQEELDNMADQSRIGSNWRIGDVRFADLNNDGIISAGNSTLDDHGDWIRIGNTTPRYTFGINPIIRYKNFMLDIFAQGIMKRDWYPSTGNFLRFFPFKSMSIEQWWIDDSWSPENRDAYFFGLQYTYSDGKNTVAQTRYLQNAAYIRLKNVTLSYRIPLKFVSEAQVYLNGTNLWEASGVYKTLDPEMPSDLVPRYMFQRGYTLGIRLTL